MIVFGILAYVNVNVINHVMLENIQTIKIVNLEKYKLIGKLVEECSKILMEMK